MSNKNIETHNLYCEKKQIRDLVAGDIILHPIFRSDGLMLINKNKKLTPSLIHMIKKHALPNTFILATSSQQEAKEDILTEGNDFFVNLLLDYPLWTDLEYRLESEQLKLRAIEAKDKLLTSMSTNKTFIELFNKIKDYDDVLFIHSINTMCISLMIGLTLELNSNELFDLAVAALFSNVGFIEIKREDFLGFLKTPEHINEQLKKHLEIFSDMTAHYPELRKKTIVYGILEHHEFYNGEGFPNRKRGTEISLFGRILCIAHNYDELVGGYNYEIGLHPLEALRIIYENVENRYDQNILNAFMYRTTYFKLGESLVLPNIQNGEIIGFDDFIRAPHLPIVRLQNGTVINLANN